MLESLYLFFIKKPEGIIRLIGTSLISFVFISEILVIKLKKLDYVDLEDTWTNLKMFFCFSATQFILLWLTVFIYRNIVAPYAFFPTGYYWWLFLGNVKWWHFAILFILDDFLFYWYHRALHKLPLLWVTHEAHHSSKFFNISTGMRQSFLQIFPIFFWWPLVLVGFEPYLVVICSRVNLTLQILLHTRTVKSLGPLEWILNSPSHHRVHHGKNNQYVDKNFGGLLIIWDRLFGTFVKEEESVVYGVKTVANDQGLWGNTIFPWRHFFLKKSG